MSPNKDGHRFRARLDFDEPHRFLDLPGHVSRALEANPDLEHQVRVSIGGIEFLATLHPLPDGSHRLFLPPKVWKELHAEYGDLIVGRIENPEDRGQR